MKLIQVFGGLGYIGSNYTKLTPGCIINGKHDYTVDKSVTDIVYFISTISNYNVLSNPYVDIDTNLILLMKILEQCKDTNITFNFISSWFVYGDTCVPADENSNCNPKGFYSITKRAAEQLLISYCTTFNIKYRILRLANVIGGQDPKASIQKNALTHMITELKAGKEINLYDNGNLYRDYINVKDVASAINLIIDKGKLNEIYNIGNGVPHLFRDIIYYAVSLIDNPGKINPISVPKFHQTVQVYSMWMKNDKLKSLGYLPELDIFKSIDLLVKDEN